MTSTHPSQTACVGPGPLLRAELPGNATGSSKPKDPRYSKTSRRIRCGGHKPMRDGDSPPLRSPIELPALRGYRALVA
jgi:hypothetical protein